MQFLKELNDEQRRAATTGEGPVLIVAGPGTGKTKTLTSRIAFLLQDHNPEEIIALTFTNKAAAEMRERLAKLLGDEMKLPKITTFHALGHELLRHEDADFKLISEQERTEIIRELKKPATLTRMNVRELSLMISNTKTSLKAEIAEALRLVVDRYETALQNQKLHDFDDLLKETYATLATSVSKRPAYKYALVDEFQDTSELQYELLKLLTPSHNIFVIGDPNQSIYAFRGAGAEMFERFRADFPKVQTIALMTNYRSQAHVVRLANAIFPEAPQLRAHRPEKQSVRAVETLNEFSEAAYVLNEIERGIGGSDMLKANGDQNVCQPRDYAVLYRTHRAAKALQGAFAESGIPFQVVGEGSPYERPEIQAVLAFMHAVLTPDETNLQVLRRQAALHYTSLAQIKTLLAKFPVNHKEPVHDLAANIAQTLGFEQDEKFQPDLRAFLGSLVQFGDCEKGLATCLEHIDKIAEREFYDPNVNAVTLLTIHASKGLEFERVFLCATEDGILPRLRKTAENDIGEERRLFYVAATRARQKLEILHARRRGGEPAKPSRFITELSPEVLQRMLDPNMELLKKRAEKRRLKRAQGTLF